MKTGLRERRRLHAATPPSQSLQIHTFLDIKHFLSACVAGVAHLRDGWYTGLSKKMDRIWNRYNLKSTGRIYTFCVLKCSEKFKVLDLP